jgi:PKD repeat protein
MARTIRLLTCFFIFFIGHISFVLSQSITVNPIASGPYGRGSSIALSLKITDPNGSLKVNNSFRLFISDASGSFSGEREIGSYAGFYTTHINGIIPADLPAGNYRLRVKNTSTTIVSAPSNTINVIAAGGVTADVDAPSSQVIANNPETFGICRPERSTVFRFNTNSTAGAGVSAEITNEITKDKTELVFEGGHANFSADMAHYTVFLKASLNGIIGTKAYFIINNAIKPGFNPPANNTVCLPAILEYDIETNSSNGIQNNFPGYSYQINWGDDVIENVTPFQIIASNGKLKHTYNRSSCGKQIKINDVNYYNVFGIIYQVNSPYCGLISVPLSTQAKVITQPENRFALPAAVCINTDIALNNTSIAGDNPSSSSPECNNNEIVYYWYIDGKPITPQGVPLSYKLNYKFSTPGFHTIRLESESKSACQAAPLERTCFVQAAPKPEFVLSEKTACVGASIKASDRSIVDLSENAQNSFSWNVTGPSAVTYENGTNNLSRNPELKFLSEGIYQVQLKIASPCGIITSEQTVVINGKPGITANWDQNLCGKGQLLSFNNTAGNSVNTSFRGSAETLANTYSWQISGGKFSFRNNTNANSKEPSIFFEDYGVYTISVTHQNNCGVETLIKTLTFNQSPTVSAGIDQTICADGSATLHGSIVGETASSFTWLGGKGNFAPSRNVLNAVYTPADDEIASGQVQLRLSVNTSNATPCNLVEDVVVIKINPVNKITSAAAKTICTTSNVSYSPTAILAGSSFTWTAAGSTNAKGFSRQGTGDINDIVENTDPVKNASIRYRITPELNGCKGETFTLTVTVTASPKMTAKAAEVTICSGKVARIELVSNLADMRYTWTSSATGSIKGNSSRSVAASVTSIADTLLNTGSATGNVTYTIIPENITGCVGEPIKVTVNVSASPGISTFSPDKTTGCSPLKITFSNTTPGGVNTYHWDFGDGTRLTTHNNNSVSHVYSSAVAKTFKAKLITETDCGQYESEYIVKIAPNTVLPELVVNGNEYEGCAPHTVKFFNNSKGAVLFKYDFGDGTVIESNRSPETIVHTFTKGGTYQVKLTASNGCSDTTTIETIKVFPGTVADFDADLREGCSSITVKFKNKSTGALSYLWDFGDGTISTAANPVHTFRSGSPSYSVRLITTSSFGCTDTLEKQDFIKIASQPKANFKVIPGLTIQYPDFRFSFQDHTEGDVATRFWDFGDGSTSSVKDPEHHYPDTGLYKVTLRVTNAAGCSETLTKSVRITGTPGSLFVPNAFMPNSLSEELRTFKAKGSGLSKWHMRVFNKWGQMIWQTDKLDEKGRPVEGWDGTMFGVQAPQGIYFWEIGAKYINGTEWAGMTYNGAEPKKTGTINLIR